MIDPIKDEDGAEQPIASAWRPVLAQIVSAFVEGDFALARGIPGVAPIDAETAEQIRDYIADYGETLVELPEETWHTSIAQWNGKRWDLLVDLFTAESGRSDMALSARVSEAGDGFHVVVELVYVP
jgi:hypothetical protein